MIAFGANHYIYGRSSYWDSLSRKYKPLIKVYALSTGSIYRTLRVTSEVSSFRMDSVEKSLFIAGDTPPLTKWSLDDSSYINISRDNDAITDIDLNSNGSLIAAAYSSIPQANVLRTIDGFVLNQFVGSGSGFFHVAFSQDGRLLVASRWGEEVCWDVSTGVKIIDITHSSSSASSVYALALNDRYIMTGDELGMIRVWNIADGSLFCVLAGHSELIFRLKLSQDGKKLFSLGYDKMSIWSVEAGNNWQPLTR